MDITVIRPAHSIVRKGDVTLLTARVWAVLRDGGQSFVTNVRLYLLLYSDIIETLV
jgi:hypothetical protein